MRAIPWESIDLAQPVVKREPLDNLTEALSGARLERVALADGRTLILKQLPADGGGSPQPKGYRALAKALASGRPARVRPFVEHTIIDMQGVDGTDVVVMRDATEDLLPARVRIPRDTSRTLLARLAAFHEAFSLPAQRVPLLARSAIRDVRAGFHAADPGPGRHPLGGANGRGWELFAEHVEANRRRGVRNTP